MSTYKDLRPIESPIAAERQSAKRHYGVHPYFTRRPYNVVKKYILHYSKEGDKVLDPFGGSGVTAIEAFLNNRVGIQNDINPNAFRKFVVWVRFYCHPGAGRDPVLALNLMGTCLDTGFRRYVIPLNEFPKGIDINPLANFIAQGVADLHKGNVSDYFSSLSDIQEKCQKRIAQIEESNEQTLKQWFGKVPLPPNIPLPSNADVESYHELFLPHQLVSLAVLKEAIETVKKEYIRKGLLLAWSATLTKLNKTFLSAEGRLASRGGSSLFSIYRYKVAKKPVSLPAWQTFHERALNIIEAKKEIDKEIEIKKLTSGWKGEFLTYELDVEDVAETLNGEIDYIFTDPPYGAHIAYLDLSTLWNGWLGFLPSETAKTKELIVGGDLNHTEEEYIERLGRSVMACSKMLKTGRWISVVFQHWNTKYFESILRSSSESGMELRAAISQVGDPIWSMHKKKGSESVLAGELILTFFKSGKSAIKKNGRHFDVEASIVRSLDSIKTDCVFGEYLFNQIILDAWDNGALSSLNISRTDFTDMIKRHGWHYDNGQHYWSKKTTQSPEAVSLFS